MTMSLYDASVMSYLQTLDAVGGLLERGRIHCRDHDIDPAVIVESRLFPDTPPFGFHILQVAQHSLGALEAIVHGMLRMVGERSSPDYAGLQALMTDTRGTLRRLTAEEINAREGADVVFEVGDTRRVFTAESFLLSFSLPNFHFHAIAACNILRSIGVPVSKLDYVGALRLKA